MSVYDDGKRRTENNLNNTVTPNNPKPCQGMNSVGMFRCFVPMSAT